MKKEKFDKNGNLLSKRSSEILMELARNKNLNDNLTYKYILQALGKRAFGIVFLFFSLPSLLFFSVIPGVSFVFSLPIAIFALEMIFGRKTLWLPKSIARKTISHKKISKIIEIVLPYVIRLERFTKTRWPSMTCGIMENINGIAILLLSFLLMLPIPFSNFIFGAFLFIFSLGLAERDGILIVIGYFLFTIYISFLYIIILAAINSFFIL